MCLHESHSLTHILNLLCENAYNTQSLAKELGAKCYVECSALTRSNLTEAVEGAFAAILPDVKKGKRERGGGIWVLMISGIVFGWFVDVSCSSLFTMHACFLFFMFSQMLTLNSMFNYLFIYLFFNKSHR
jgi:hypothetical protein